MTECNKRDEITEHTEASKHTHTHTASLLCSTTEGQRSEVRDVVNSDVRTHSAKNDRSGFYLKFSL